MWVLSHSFFFICVFVFNLNLFVKAKIYISFQFIELIFVIMENT